MTPRYVLPYCIPFSPLLIWIFERIAVDFSGVNKNDRLN